MAVKKVHKKKRVVKKKAAKKRVSKAPKKRIVRKKTATKKRSVRGSAYKGIHKTWKAIPKHKRRVKGVAGLKRKKSHKKTIGAIHGGLFTQALKAAHR